MSITGEADGPPLRLGVAIADIVSGMFAAQGIAMALLARDRTGRGQRVDIGMLDSTAALLTYQAAHLLRDRHARRRASATATRRSSRTRPSPPRTATSCSPSATTICGDASAASIGLTELADDPRFATNRARVEHYDELQAAARSSAAHATREPSGSRR